MKVKLRAAISDHELVSGELDLLRWTRDRLLSEMYHRWPVKNEIVYRWRNQLYQEVVMVEADWKEPVQ
jgi:hypothetical protein